ncbi:dTDP-4-dehydrorhamnose reductase [Tenuifilum osseticum]|uniref:dTDP-4-dehydrorhamnose reductase n=1 Tax=Tenuifilum osseticum TaxID=3374723 RepID=UPI0034E427ED
MKILVTGANGQLGTVIKKESSIFPDLAIFYTDIEETDICSKESVQLALKKYAPNVVVNCAAYTAVDKAEDEEDKAFALNADAPANLAEQCKLMGVKLIHISTDYVFDGKSNVPYVETDKVNPQSVYGKSKLEGELRSMALGNTMVIRTSWLYSAYGNNFMKTMLKYGKERPELRVVFDQTGTPTLANDLAYAILRIAESPERLFTPEIFHFSNQGVCSWYDFAYEIIKQAGLTTKITPITTSDYPTKAIRPQYSVLNKQKITNLLEMEIPHWRQSLVKCLQEYLR